jgi:hypothetical protein
MNNGTPDIPENMEEEVKRSYGIKSLTEGKDSLRRSTLLEQT